MLRRSARRTTTTDNSAGGAGVTGEQHNAAVAAVGASVSPVSGSKRKLRSINSEGESSTSVHPAVHVPVGAGQSSSTLTGASGRGSRRTNTKHNSQKNIGEGQGVIDEHESRHQDIDQRSNTPASEPARGEEQNLIGYPWDKGGPNSVSSAWKLFGTADKSRWEYRRSFYKTRLLILYQKRPRRSSPLKRSILPGEDEDATDIAQDLASSIVRWRQGDEAQIDPELVTPEEAERLKLASAKKGKGNANAADQVSVRRRA